MSEKKKKEEDTFKVNIYPCMRVYISISNEERDQMEIEEFYSIIGNKSATDFVREMLDEGLANIYFCSFNTIDKVV